jgi:hypothetical protein
MADSHADIDRHVKIYMVACYFMHLISEKKLILAVMVLTVVFFVALLFGPILTEQDVISQ